jgi:hypothetical protein
MAVAASNESFRLSNDSRLAYAPDAYAAEDFFVPHDGIRPFNEGFV